jgi:hypothetical protein
MVLVFWGRKAVSLPPHHLLLLVLVGARWLVLFCLKGMSEMLLVGRYINEKSCHYL